MKLLTVFIFFLLTTLTNLTTFYDFSINTMEGSSLPLNNFQGKKVLLVVLPITQTEQDSLMLHALDSLSANTTVKIIGVPAYEDGYADSMKVPLLQWYRATGGSNIILTEGMNTRKNTGQQNLLFKWLTGVEGNGHFDEDVDGSWSKYFINEQGELYAVFGPEVPLHSTAIKRILL